MLKFTESTNVVARNRLTTITIHRTYSAVTIAEIIETFDPCLNARPCWLPQAVWMILEVSHA